MSDRDESSSYKHSLLLSYPVYAKYANLTTFKEIRYERLVLKLKEGCTIENENKIFNDIR